MNVMEFMAELYKGAPSEQVTYLFTLPDRATYPYKIGQMDQMLEKAMALSCSKDVYFGLHLMDEPPFPGGRASASDIRGISFIHGEYDIKGPAHKEENLPKTQEELIAFLHGLECPPSIIVHSGNGLHTYWLLQEYTAVNDENRESIRRIVKGHELHTQKLGRAYGWRFDSVADLARVLRIPGTLNHKSDPPRQVEIIEANLARYPLSAFAEYADEAAEYTGERIHFAPAPDRVGPAQRIIDGCAFVRHCRDEAANLPEPEWYAMITNLAPASDGTEAVHKLSEAYLDYSEGETDAKIRHALAQNKPHTCRHIRECLGFECPAGGCGVKAPVVLAQYTLEERVQQLLERELTAEDVFEENTLSLMAYAREQMPGVYGKFKLRLRRLGVSLRDFERAVIHQAEMEKLQSAEFDVIGSRPISIAELDLHGAVEPEGFSVSLKDGIQKTALAFGETVMLPVASEPVVITRKLENVDDGQEKLEITFRRNGKLKSIRIQRSAALNKTQLIRYADSGLPVNSGNAEDMVGYLAAYEAKNNGCIPCVRSIDRIGWIGREFYPYHVDGAMELETEAANVSQMIGGLTQEGSLEAWLKAAEIVRAGSVSRAVLAGSFASPLLHWLKQRVFLEHVWHDSRGGKTATLKLALSVWGDPLKLLTSYHATAVGLERSCAAMMHLPLGLDELQALTEKRMSVESIVYSLGNGFGKLRGAKNGGLQKTLLWRNIILSTGEMPLIRESCMDGVGSRVLELYGRPIADEAKARELHQVSERNYGHAGRRYIQYLAEEVLSEDGKLESLYRDMQERLRAEYGKKHEGEPGVSENCKWRIRKKFEQGIPTGLCMYGYKVKNGVFTIIPEEAEIVRRIFSMYLEGIGCERIMKALIEAGVPAPDGGLWSASTILLMLRNEKYAGDLLLQKYYINNHIEKKQLPNRGELPQYAVAEDHEPIIDRATFDAVQKEIRWRAAVYATAMNRDDGDEGCDSRKPDKPAAPAMAIPIICGICGKRYRRKITRRGTAYAAPVWICSTYNYRGKAYCASKQIPEAILLELIAVALDNRHSENEVDHLEVYPNNRVLFVFRDEHVEEHFWKDHSPKDSWNTDKRKKAAEKTRAQHQRRRECVAQ